MGMARQYTKHIHVKVDDDLYNKAKKLAEKNYEGNIAMLIRKLIDEKYKQEFGDKA
jgi:hypothetical protein